jgi:peptidoglycan hydrolase-like protein with peptidoglycan-binding domain
MAPLVAGLLILLVSAPDVAAGYPAAYPVQSIGNRGSDVRTLQYLLREAGRTVPSDGVFGVSTQEAVAAHQAARDLPVTGVVDAATWATLTPNLSLGDSGHAVRGLQRLLNEKRGSGIAIDAVFRSTTRSAVLSFQRHMGGTATGTVNAVFWKRLLWHFERPTWTSATGLCDYSVGNGAANWGTGAAIGQLEAAAKRIYDAGHGRVPVGDAGFEHGGDIPGHMSHEQGLDIDLRPMRTGENQCTWGGSYRLSNYDRAATRALVLAIRATAPRHVKLIYFNDPVLIREGLTTWYTGHDDHLHVRYCEAGHALSAYRCPAPRYEPTVAVSAPVPAPRSEPAAVPGTELDPERAVARAALVIGPALGAGSHLASALRAIGGGAALAR